LNEGLPEKKKERKEKEKEKELPQLDLLFSQCQIL